MEIDLRADPYLLDHFAMGQASISGANLGLSVDAYCQDADADDLSLTLTHEIVTECNVDGNQ